MVFCNLFLFLKLFCFSIKKAMLKAADQIKHDRTWCVPINIETTFVTKTIFFVNLNFLIPQMQNH